jgi:hypothetical protein
MNDDELRRHFARIDAKITGIHWAIIVFISIGAFALFNEAPAWHADFPDWLRPILALGIATLTGWGVGKVMGFKSDKASN